MHKKTHHHFSIFIFLGNNIIVCVDKTLIDDQIHADLNARFAIFVQIGAFKVGVVSWLIAIESADETGGERTRMSLIISLYKKIHMIFCCIGVYCNTTSL
jgi:hypothetical protein